MSSASTLISALAFIISMAAFYVSFQNYRRSINFINAEYELMPHRKSSSGTFSKLKNDYWVKIWISNRGKDATTIRHVRLHIEKLNGTKLTSLEIMTLFEVNPETEVIIQNFRRKILPGEMVLFSPSHTLFEKLKDSSFKSIADMNFSLWVRHSQKSQMEIISLPELKKELIYWEKHISLEVVA